MGDWGYLESLTEWNNKVKAIREGSDSHYGISKYNAEKRVELFNKLINVEEILHENNDYIYETLRLRAFYYWLSEDYIKLKNYDNALNCIEKFAEQA